MRFSLLRPQVVHAAVVDCIVPLGQLVTDHDVKRIT